MGNSSKAKQRGNAAGVRLISHGRVAENRKARFNYEVLDTIEAGIVLYGSEVKSMRLGRVSIAESYAVDLNGEIFLKNMEVPVYNPSSNFSHEPKRDRKLLLHNKEVQKLIGDIARGGMTLVPLSLYFNRKGLAKVSLGLARGKQQQDKRQTIKQREWDREKHRLLKN